MQTLFIEYPPCSTCRNAKKFLQQHQIDFQARHIVEDTPSVQELQEWCQLSNISVDKLFKTSGQVYRNLALKDKLSTMSSDEKFTLLSQNGMLIKRPLLIHDQQVLVGFKEAQWLSLVQIS